MMIKNILFDFDGVILDSMPIREYGFRKIFEEYDENLVKMLLDYHNKNGGLSRYVKIRYFFEELLGENISEQRILDFAEKFSIMMKKELVNKRYLISDTVEFIDKNIKKYNFHIVSGSDEKELQYLCNKLDIEKYFISIHGSPRHKNKLVETVLAKNIYNDYETILIGDSVNDYEAAVLNNIEFYGINNHMLVGKSKHYLNDYGVLS